MLSLLDAIVYLPIPETSNRNHSDIQFKSFLLTYYTVYEHCCREYYHPMASEEFIPGGAMQENLHGTTRHDLLFCENAILPEAGFQGLLPVL